MAKKPHVWVIEVYWKFKPGLRCSKKWEMFLSEENVAFPTRTTAQRWMRRYNSDYSNAKFRVRKYERVGT